MARYAVMRCPFCQGSASISGSKLVDGTLVRRYRCNDHAVCQRKFTTTETVTETFGRPISATLRQSLIRAEVAADLGAQVAQFIAKYKPTDKEQP